MAESEELKNLVMKVKEDSEKVGLTLNIQKMKIMASRPITWWGHNSPVTPGLGDLTHTGQHSEEESQLFPSTDFIFLKTFI